MSIQSFSCPETQQLFVTGRSARFSGIANVAMRKLTQLDNAPRLHFMRMPPGNDLKSYAGAWHVRINRQWRLALKWGEGGHYDVKIEDPH